MPILRPIALFAVLTAPLWVSAAEVGGPGDRAAAFRQLHQLLPTPNVYRSASGAPGPQYWQQRADYQIEATLDEQARTITGRERITYTNNSPDTLRFLWVQLDQNRWKADSLDRRTRTTPVRDGEPLLTFGEMRSHQFTKDHDLGYDIQRVEDGRGRPLATTIVDTMMRVDLAEPLAPGATTELRIDWTFEIVQETAVNSRGGYELFPDSDSDAALFFLAQWFPRMAAYTDYESWQHKPFLGRGEFTLEFGDYDVRLTVPADHVVSSTGALQNPREVLTMEQRRRLARARDADEPVFIVTPEEALENQAEGTSRTATWHFRAENVRDFAWASSRKFIWDAMGHRQDDAEQPLVMAMSFYPIEAEPIWSRYSTEAVVHTMEVYSRFSFPYPYPVAQSVNTWKSGGMEYPMITFNGYRPDPVEADDDDEEEAGDAGEEASGDGEAMEPIVRADGVEVTYSRGARQGLVGVIIHEIGHIYFPMTVNSDERQWTWMDEGINSFLQYLAELEWDDDFHQHRGELSLLDRIAPYMKSANQVPIMTNSESILQFGPNAYRKPASALVVLRETVMGRELFDHAFREYANRWKFKRPTPSDLFRTLEDASSVDLDWFWRGWFYTTDHVDVNLHEVAEFQVSTMDPTVERPLDRQREADRAPPPITALRNAEEGRRTREERRPRLHDFYTDNDRFTVSNKERNDYTSYLEGLEDWQRDVLERALADEEYVYFLTFVNEGGLVTPLPLRLTYEDGATEDLMIPAELWRRNSERVMRTIIRPRKVVAFELDPRHQTADVDRSDNHFPRRIERSRIELYKSDFQRRDLMAEMLVELKGTGDDSPEAGEGMPLDRPGGGS
jgi:hypothetical protein